MVLVVEYYKNTCGDNDATMNVAEEGGKGEYNQDTFRTTVPL